MWHLNVTQNHVPHGGGVSVCPELLARRFIEALPPRLDLICWCVARPWNSGYQTKHGSGYDDVDDARRHRSNENKMSDGGRDRALLGVEVWKSSRKWSGQRSAVRSIAWLDVCHGTRMKSLS